MSKLGVKYQIKANLNNLFPPLNSLSVVGLLDGFNTAVAAVGCNGRAVLSNPQMNILKNAKNNPCINKLKKQHKRHVIRSFAM